MLDDSELDQLTSLCRVACSREEKIDLKKNLNKVLGHIEKLKEVNTDGIEPCYTVLDCKETPLREDIPENTLARDEFLSIALHTGGMVRVPPVIHFANP